MRLRIYATVFLFILASSCGKESSGVPDVYVNYPFTEQEFQIKNTNNSLIVPDHGVAGLIIYKGPAGFVAYDRCSTVNPEKRCAVSADESGLTVTDPCSGAKYSLYDGAPVKAPAKTSLKQYMVTRNNIGYTVIN